MGILDLENVWLFVSLNVLLWTVISALVDLFLHVDARYIEQRCGQLVERELIEPIVDGCDITGSHGVAVVPL